VKLQISTLTLLKIKNGTIKKMFTWPDVLDREVVHLMAAEAFLAEINVRTYSLQDLYYSPEVFLE
jgi:hypothetical protein